MKNEGTQKLELRRFFRNNGVVTETMAKSIFNRINIELVTTTNGKINQDLIDDLVLIRNTYPQLLRHTTIINNTGSQADMQPIIDILATYPNNSFDTFCCSNCFLIVVNTAYKLDLN